MKQQQAQAYTASGPLSERDIEAVAMQNFEARNTRRDRAWSRTQGDGCPPALPLSERERLEFIEYARHQLESEARRWPSPSGPPQSQAVL